MNSSGNQTKESPLNNQVDRIRILIVDDQKMIREGLKALIKTEEDFEVVGTAEDGEDAIKQVESLQPNIVLMDMEMPGLDGMGATQVICEQFPDIKVLVLSTYDNQEYVARSLGAGAMGYLLKGTPAKELTEAIRSVYRGYAQIGPGAFQKILPLTPKSFSDSASATASDVTSGSAVNGNGKLVATMAKENRSASALAVKNSSSLAERKFEETVVLRQSPRWSRAIIWSIIGVTTFAVIWASVAKIEQVVPARGQLKPIGKVKEIQVPTNGVVEEVEVEEGQKVKKGDLLLTLDETTSQAQLESEKNIRQSLLQENKFYRALMNGEITGNTVENTIASLNIPREVAFLARNRGELLSENQLFLSQLGADSGNLSAEQLARLNAAQTELQSRIASARLEAEQLEKQLNQNQVQLADARAKLATAKQVLAEIEQRNRDAIAQAEESLKIERNILKSVEPLSQQGALSQFQVETQRQKVNDRYKSLIEQRSTGTIERDRAKQEIQTASADIERLQEEEQRLRLDITQAREQLLNTTSLSEREIRDKMAENNQRIAEIDTQLNKSIVENDKRIAELNSQISGTEQTLKYQALYAPVGGTVFDLKAYPGYVPPAGQNAEPILKIVPDDQLIGEVFITTNDIGFVQKGMITDVRIDTFPFSEFGDVKGTVSSIGSDALEPDQTYDYFRFPAKIELERQDFTIKGKNIPLQSGMSISANIKINENRTVLSLFTEQFFVGLDKFKQVR
ncbi:response regulator receiver protein [Stanieria cyanosphaera PCC 7437]|uniref:Response regulator receiver protein n=1 Tax=Stanieria cyanosphaera (strain ATCC 29371 / PCC 7437) TaxID=111780 RepID=K9XT38_STAC7|nr:response regulator [Stanieria cyanosphaera]AFZ35770.1 response regulator receiver protein [Stanieria cyanosphaera PCC 7437]